MINTICDGCLFANMDNKQCYFDIPEIIKDIKKITEKNGGLYIEDYGCRYCFSKEIYEKNTELHNINISQYVVNNAKMKYYLVVNLENCIDNLVDLCRIISDLDIKPQYISFINKDKDKAEFIAKDIDNNLKIGIKWKLHNFIIDNSLQECITISLDTNIQKTETDMFLVYDPKANELDFDTLNNRINFLQIECIVKQTKFNAALVAEDTIDGMAISFAAYKFLLLNVNKNILEAMKLESEFTRIYYNDSIK